MSKNKLKVLDCTLRDGGYYNDWRFSNQIVQEYVKSVNLSKIDVLEIGFRFLKKNNLGIFANSFDKQINKFIFRKNLKIAVMLNASDFDFSEDYKSQISKYFSLRRNSKISIVRIATHLKDIKKIIPHIKFLKKFGYHIVVNLMQIDKVNSKELISSLNILRKSQSINTFYFADSFGSLNPNDVKNICNIIKKNWNKEFGFHAHDNCGLALQNALTAIKYGAKWIDSTIQGMGRGAGNVATEDLLCEINHIYKFKYNLEPIFNLSQNEFKKLKQSYKWGKSIYYHLSAKLQIHPTYIQELLKDDRYNHQEILEIINSLGKIKSSSYSSFMLNNFINEKINFKKCWNSKNWCKNKNILILGQGQSIKKYNNFLLNFVKKNKCFVLSLNINKHFNKKLIKYFVVSNESRMLVDFAKYKTITRKLIMPMDRANRILGKLITKKTKNYGFIVKKDHFDYYDKYCILPNSLAIGYAIAVSLSGGCKRVFLAGFDGFKMSNPKNREMKNYLDFLKVKTNLKISSITPSRYFKS